VSLTEVFLAVIALALVVMTAVQLAVLLRMARLARKAAAANEEISRELRPLIAKVHRVADDATRVSALAVVQVERVDQLVASTAAELQQILGVVRASIVEPLRTGSAFVHAMRAAFGFISRSTGSAKPLHREDEDALFVG
jgi:hypothetical protein